LGKQPEFRFQPLLLKLSQVIRLGFLPLRFRAHFISAFINMKKRSRKKRYNALLILGERNAA
jgi:hypothetical protein